MADDVAPERWAELGRAITRRMAELQGMTMTQLQNRSGVSRETLRPIVNGQPGNYRDTTLVRLSHALGWSVTSIHQFLEGGDVTIESTPAPDDEQYEATLRTVEALADHVMFKPDLIFTLPDGTEVIVEVKGRGKVREAEVLQQVEGFLKYLRTGRLTPQNDLARARAAAAAVAAEDLAREATYPAEADDEDDEFLQALHEAIRDLPSAAKDADAATQTLARLARRPGADAPIEEDAP